MHKQPAKVTYLESCSLTLDTQHFPVPICLGSRSTILLTSEHHGAMSFPWHRSILMPRFREVDQLDDEGYVLPQLRAL